jgi:beta propeller repeat protein
MVTRSALARVVVLTVVFAVLGAVSVAYAYTVPMVEQLLTSGAGFRQYPAISGTKVVYTDSRNDGDIWVSDLATNAARQLTSEGRQDKPAISGDKVVYMQWIDGGPVNSEIFCYDLTTNQASRLTSATGPSEYPAIDGDRVVWGDYRSGAQGIYVYDLSTHRESRIATSTGIQSSPSISGDRIAYVDTRNGNCDIYCYDLATHTERRVTTDPADQTLPSIDGDWVTYSDRRNGNYDVYAFNLATGIETRLTTDPNSQYDSKVSGTKVVYMSNGSGVRWDILLYDLATGRETTLTGGPTTDEYPAIDGDRVVYGGAGNGRNDIYLGELATPRISVSAPAMVAQGATVRVTGTMASFTGIPMADRWVKLETSVNGVSWTGTTQVKTDGAGAFSLTSPALTSARYVRAAFDGEAANLSAQSAPVLVKPKALLGTPVAPSTMSRTKAYTIYASLKPSHADGTYGGTLQCYRLESGKWKLRRSFSLSAYDYSTYSRVRGSVKLTSKGKWRMRVYHSDASHAPTYSGWRTVTVK